MPNGRVKTDVWCHSLNEHITRRGKRNMNVIIFLFVGTEYIIWSKGLSLVAVTCVHRKFKITHVVCYWSTEENTGIKNITV